MVTETDIAWPVDARLLNDSVRVMSRYLERLREALPELVFRYHNHTRRSKKRAYQIAVGRGKNIETRRHALYENLLAVQQKACGYIEGALAAAGSIPAAQNHPELKALEEILELAQQVYSQAYRRIVLGEKVRADEKPVSIFETHTDIICRGKKDSKVEFGHKIGVGTGRSGLVTFYEVLRGNPGDSELLGSALDYHEEIFGKMPKEMTADKRFFSAQNEKMATSRGVERVALPKLGRLNQLRCNLQKQGWFRRLLRWRAGIEGNLSTLLRRFGLKRCLWKGWESFGAYVGLSVLTYNLRLLAGHLHGT